MRKFIFKSCIIVIVSCNLFFVESLIFTFLESSQRARPPPPDRIRRKSHGVHFFRSHLSDRLEKFLDSILGNYPKGVKDPFCGRIKGRRYYASSRQVSLTSHKRFSHPHYDFGHWKAWKPIGQKDSVLIVRWNLWSNFSIRPSVSRRRRWRGRTTTRRRGWTSGSGWDISGMVI